MTTTAAPTPGPLPRGRHGLSRTEVVDSQRARMLFAMAEAVAETGYAKASVADVLRRAGVSRETFYQQFSSKEDCFLATFDEAGTLLLADLARAWRQPGGDRGPAGATDPGDRFERVLAAYLDALAEHPAFAKVFLVESHAAGPEALRRRALLQDRFADALADLLGARGPHERLACEVLVAGISSMVTTRIALDGPEAVRALHAPLTDLVRHALDRR